jgi:hypothetical protein
VKSKQEQNFELRGPIGGTLDTSLFEEFKNTALRKKFGPKRLDVTEQWLGLHASESHNLCSLCNITAVMKSELEMPHGKRIHKFSEVLSSKEALHSAALALLAWWMAATWHDSWCWRHVTRPGSRSPLTSSYLATRESRYGGKMNEDFFSLPSSPFVRNFFTAQW